MKALDVDHDELRRGDTEGRLFNDDLAPARADDRSWNSYSLFSLWMNDAHNASNYTFAAALFIGTGTLMGMTPARDRHRRARRHGDHLRGVLRIWADGI